MVSGGVDSDGTQLFIGRADHMGDMLPAKVMPDKQIAFVCYQGQEVMKEEFEVLVRADFVWEFASNGTVPDGAISCGCLLYTSPSPRDGLLSRMPSSA